MSGPLLVIDRPNAANFLRHIDDGRPWAATRMGLDLLDDRGPAALIDELLVPVQVESGQRWQDRTYSVSQEHQVTGLVDELLGATSAILADPDPDAPRVTLVCAEGEWHASAARMTSLRLRSERWDVRFLGGSVPAAELESHLRMIAPDALLISCTMAAALPGAAAMASTARRVGIPVIAGGAAFRLASEAGARVGADLVAGTTDEARRALADWRANGMPADEHAATRVTNGERASFAVARRDLVQSVVEQTTGPFRPEDEAEVDSLLATLDAALLLEDLGVLRHHMAWLAERERAQQVLPLPLEQVVRVLQRRMPPELRTSRSYLSDAAGLLHTG